MPPLVFGFLRPRAGAALASNTEQAPSSLWKYGGTLGTLVENRELARPEAPHDGQVLQCAPDARPWPS